MAADQITKALAGRAARFVRDEFDWTVDFGDGNTLRLGSPWRIIAEGRIAWADADDGQQFGLPAPLDGEHEANRLIGGRSVSRVTVGDDTGDLHLHFGPGIRLEVCTWSAGYEGWQVTLSEPGRWAWFICLGGGTLSVFTGATDAEGRHVPDPS